MDVKLMSNSYYSQVALLDIILKRVLETTQTRNKSNLPIVNSQISEILIWKRGESKEFPWWKSL